MTEAGLQFMYVTHSNRFGTDQTHLFNAPLTEDVGANLLQVRLLTIPYVIQVGDVIHVDVYSV